MPAQELPSRACAKCVWQVTVSTVQPQESYPEEDREGEDPHRKKTDKFFCVKLKIALTILAQVFTYGTQVLKQSFQNNLLGKNKLMLTL